MEDGILDSFFGEAYVYSTTLIEMNDVFKTRLLSGYAMDKSWDKVRLTLEANQRLDNADQAVLPFELDEEGLIYHINGEGVRRLCIPEHDNLIKDVLRLTHDEIGHPGFHRTYERITESLYIQRLYTTLREFIRHCPNCQAMASPQHSPYGSLQPIVTPASLHHTITIDFVLGLPESPSPEEFDSVMSITDKFSKRVTFIPGRTTYTAVQWAHLLLDRLDTADWGIPKAIISDRDRKFVSEIWRAIFEKKGVELLYSTAYYPQTDGQSEQTNQTFEIALCHYIAGLGNAKDWPSVLPKMQSIFNNSTSNATGQSPNKVLYGRKVAEAIDHIARPHTAETSEEETTARPDKPSCINPKDAIDFANMQAKRHYDRKHTAMFLKVGNYANLRLHRGYILPAFKKNPKLTQQFVGPFKVLRRVGRLAYELEIPPIWKIHPVFTIAMLEPASAPAEDPFQRPRPNHPPLVEVEGKPEWEIDRLLDKRVIRKGRGWST
ncbi:probable transposable element [Lasallia pustulata]|uniref:Probable transposable element n=1 Tax=Lasallia pustulata TaxID=136370 RepID=A0A1W5DDP6_9LECA|nr:probable transposable element [Lasallia pustulata]